MNDEGESWDSIKHFTKQEFACEDNCGFDAIDLKLVEVLETIRAHFGGKPVIITSGCRCSKFNRKVRRSGTDQNM